MRILLPLKLRLDLMKRQGASDLTGATRFFSQACLFFQGFRQTGKARPLGPRFVSTQPYHVTR